MRRSEEGEGREMKRGSKKGIKEEQKGNQETGKSKRERSERAATSFIHISSFIM